MLQLSAVSRAERGSQASCATCICTVVTQQAPDKPQHQGATKRAKRSKQNGPQVLGNRFWPCDPCSDQSPCETQALDKIDSSFSARCFAIAADAHARQFFEAGVSVYQRHSNHNRDFRLGKMLSNCSRCRLVQRKMALRPLLPSVDLQLKPWCRGTHQFPSGHEYSSVPST